MQLQLTTLAPSIWRPLRGPVKDWPLAMMDYRSVKPENQHPTDLWRHQFELRGQTVSFSHDEGQKWYYLDGHQSDEVTFIKIWDSKKDVVAKCKFSECDGLCFDAKSNSLSPCCIPTSFDTAGYTT
jgi:hypothetical protein